MRQRQPAVLYLPDHRYPAHRKNRFDLSELAPSESDCLLSHGETVQQSTGEITELLHLFLTRGSAVEFSKQETGLMSSAEARAAARYSNTIWIAITKHLRVPVEYFLLLPFCFFIAMTPEIPPMTNVPWALSVPTGCLLFLAGSFLQRRADTKNATRLEQIQQRLDHGTVSLRLNRPEPEHQRIVDSFTPAVRDALFELKDTSPDSTGDLRLFVEEHLNTVENNFDPGMKQRLDRARWIASDPSPEGTQ